MAKALLSLPQWRAVKIAAHIQVGALIAQIVLRKREAMFKLRLINVASCYYLPRHGEIKIRIPK